ncbi:hypothetical protein LWI29_016111 [Acer saccharum]|uniref:Uncharacterized protein n=1 Tax=Acer saccharum TaxID=4024 RepID=A0AA39S5E7_ACESA|nr:hypothetical protein LWI29_016111 [Acer saccharum]
MPTGTIGSRAGSILAGCGSFVAMIKGKGGHDAKPQATRDPVLAVSFAILAHKQIVSRETNPIEARVIKNQAAVHQCSGTVDFLEDKLRPYPANVNDEDRTV